MISVQNLIVFSLFVQFFACVKINEIGLNTKNNSLFIDHELIIDENEMSTAMTASIVAHSALALDKISDDVKASENIKMFMEQAFNGTWFVMVGKSFTSYNKIPHLNGTYISFSYKERTVVALQLKLEINGCISTEDLIINARNSDIKIIFDNGFGGLYDIKILTTEIIKTASSLSEIASQLKKQLDTKYPLYSNWIVDVGMKKYFGYSELLLKQGKDSNYYYLFEKGEIIVKIVNIFDQSLSITHKLKM